MCFTPQTHRHENNALIWREKFFRKKFTFYDDKSDKTFTRSWCENPLFFKNIDFRRFLEEQIERSITGQQTLILSDWNLSIGNKWWRLFMLRLRNQHSLFSICFRHEGTNHTTIERIGIWFFRLIMFCAISAIFYGQRNENNFWVIGFISSFVSYFLTTSGQTCFEYARPPEVKIEEVLRRDELAPRKQKRLPVCRVGKKKLPINELSSRWVIKCDNPYFRHLGILWPWSLRSERLISQLCRSKFRISFMGSFDLQDFCI